MSIFAYVGLPGSGKSYGVVANQVLPALKDGRLVVTNLPLKVELLREVIPGCELRTFQTSEVAEDPESIDEVFPPGCVAVIDEVWRLWPAGQKVDRIPESFKSFLAEHRHRVDKKGRSTQIVLVTQDLAQVAAFARQLVEQTFVHRKLGALGMRGRYTVNVYEGNVTGLTPPDSKKIASNVGRYDESVYRFYTSHTMSESSEAGADEAPVDDRGNVWRRPVIWLGLVGALCGLGFGGTWVYHAVHEPGAAVGGNVVTRHGATAISSTALPSGVATTAAVWRVSGYLRESAAATGGYAFVTDGTSWEYVPLRDCIVQRFKVRCDFNGRTVESRSVVPAKPIAEPIGPYVVSDADPSQTFPGRAAAEAR